MKKLLGTMLALALGTGSASAELLKNLKVSGQLDVQNTSARNVFDFSTDRNPAPAADNNNDRVSASWTRVMLTAEWDLLDDVHSQVTFRKNDRLWGTVGAGGTQGAAGSQAIGSAAAAAGTVAGNVYLDRAAITIDKLMGRFDVTVGRQYYGEPGDLVIYFGPKDTHGLFVTSIDALRVESSNDWFNFSGLFGTTARNTATAAVTVGAPNNNTQVKGFDLGWKNLPIKLNSYIWNRNIQGAAGLGVAPAGAVAGGLNDNLYIYGLKLRGEAAGGWLSVDLAQNAGQDRTTNLGACVAMLRGANGCPSVSSNYVGRAILIDTGYNMDVANVGGVTTWANFGWGSGRSSNVEGRNETFTGIASDYRPGVINRRFNAAGAQNLGNLMATSAAAGAGFGTVGLGNRVVVGGGLNFTPAKHEQLTLGISGWDYRIQRATKLAAAGTNGDPAAAGNRHLGTEFGFTADWRHSDNVTVGAGWATFQPGGFVKESIRLATVPGTLEEGNNPASMVFADLTVRF